MFAYLTLFTWSFLAATLLPIGSEAAVLILVRQHYSLSAIVMVATIGNYLGACTTYWIAAHAARGVIRASARERRASRLIARHGRPALLLSWLPIVGAAIVAAAGVAQMPFWPFSVFTLIGKFLRYLALVWGADTYWTWARATLDWN